MRRLSDLEQEVSSPEVEDPEQQYSIFRNPTETNIDVLLSKSRSFEAFNATGVEHPSISRLPYRVTLQMFRECGLYTSLAKTLVKLWAEEVEMIKESCKEQKQDDNAKLTSRNWLSLNGLNSV